MLNKLVLENLKYRWVRTFLSALVVGVQVMMILTLIGLSRGLLQESAKRAKAIGADIFLRKDTNAISFSQGQIPAGFIPLVQKQPHISAVLGMYSVSVQPLISMNGIDYDELKKFNGGLQFLKGGPFKTPDDIIVDDYYARQYHLTIGDTVTFVNHKWHVCGIVNNGQLGHLIVPIRTLQSLTGSLEPPRFTQVAVKVTNPAETNQVVGELNTVLKGNLIAMSAEALESQYSVNNIPALRIFIDVITGLSVFVGFLIVFLSMYTAVVERTREIGILKALGAKPIRILDLLVREAILLALAGWIFGILLSFAAKALIVGLVPASLPVVTTPDWWPKAAAIAIIGALLGAIYPGLKAARQDAIEALAYE
ncbi:MAG TPA: ABC transporter permease [Bryobacteraceae bacterium]|jgi:putative ABC transport system permease protein|nr:ABC transporter permease [Bryobacteraceae bacterium]